MKVGNLWKLIFLRQLGRVRWDIQVNLGGTNYKEPNFKEIHPDRKTQRLSRVGTYTDTLKLTASLHLEMDAWNTTFLLGRPILRGKLLALGSVFVGMH